MNIPVYINVRDRVTHLRQLVSWLETAGYERIILLDNASTYEPLLSFLKESPHEVRWLGVNHGSRSLWRAGMVPDEWFVFTDPDLVPIAECPHDLVERLHELAVRHQWPKAALGLYLEDVPDSMDSLDWERSLVSDERQVEPGVYDSMADTTFALYRPHSPFGYFSLRTGFPYQARHMSWYVSEPSPEDRYYLERAIPGPDGSSWAQGYNCAH